MVNNEEKPILTSNLNQEYFKIGAIATSFPPEVLLARARTQNGASMAIAFAHVSIHTRAKGHSAVAASAYRTGTKLLDSRTGLTHDFSNRKDVVFSKLLLPEGSDSRFLNREFLWNQVEIAETRKNAQVCKDVMLALPKELTLEQQIELATSFAEKHFIANGLPTDIAIHNHGDGNPHAHLLITTRRLEKTGFSKHKARDLNPAFAKNFIVEKDHWGELWREFQNNFFKEHNLDFVVDLNHVISEKHRGRFRDESTSYVHEEKQLIKEARRETVLLKPKDFISHIAKSHSVFTRRDIEKLVFKTFAESGGGSAENYLQIVAQILENKNVIKLGANDQGMDAFTTRKQYRQEAALLSHVEALYASKNHVPRGALTNLIQQYALNEEQAEALYFIAKGEDISLLVGRPGAGKSYLLKPLNELYKSNNYTVLGAALSGKVAKSLQAETGINSSTIASLSYRLKTGRLTLNKNHILIIDEAGMVDVDNMAFLLKSVKRAGAKIVLVGDPEQLKPIHKGEIFRGIAARVGYIELENIKRQHDLGDRKASIALAKGQVGEALGHYVKKGAHIFSKTREESVKNIVIDWQDSLNTENLKEHVMLAYSRAAVASLNKAGREALQQQEIVKKDEYEYFSENGERKILLAEGERILFRQNDKALGIRNGDLATINSINAYSFKAILDSGEEVTIPRTYRQIEYGYALTVHKSQGMTKNKCFVFIDSRQWDKHLAFVAMTRHRETLKIYSHKSLYPDFKDLVTTLSRSQIKDNVIDWPLDYALRAGFDPDGLIGRVIQHIAKTTANIKDKWNFIMNYEAFLNTKKAKVKLSERQAMRTIVQKVALFMDEAEDLRKEFKKVEKEAKEKGIKQSELPQFEQLYKRSLLRDKEAARIMATENETVEKMPNIPKVLESIKQYSERYVRYQAIEAIAKLSIIDTDIDTKQLSRKSAKIDLEKDRSHIIRLANQYNKSPELLKKQIGALLQQHTQGVLKDLQSEYPVLAEYEKLMIQRAKTCGYRGENLDKSLQIMAKKIIENKVLMDVLSTVLPHIADKIQKSGHYRREHTFDL